MLNPGTRQGFYFLPPWLWLWLVGFALYLPENIGETRTLLNRLYIDARNLQDDSRVPASQVYGIHHEDPLRWLIYLPDLIAIIIVLVGILTVLVPHARAAYLQRRFRLEETAMSPAIKEIGTFVHEHAPRIRIKSNLLRTDQLAFVYPLGYRRTGLAVFGGMVKHWRSDRKAAEATILHEIAHYRNGDVLIVGAGSSFSAFIRYGVLLLCVTTFLANFPVYTILMVDLQYPGSTLITAFVGTIWGLLDIPLLVVTILAIPVVGIWCAEFSADRAALEAQGSSDALERVLMALQRPKSRWRWLLFRLTHPPDKMRRWLAQQSDGLMRATLLLLLFPMTAAIQMLLNYAFRGQGVLHPLYLVIPPIVNTFGEFGDITYHPEWDVFASHLQRNLDQRVHYWLAMAILLLLWPAAARYGRWLFQRRRQTITTFRPEVYKASLLSAAIMIGLLGLYYYGVPRYEWPPSGLLPAGNYSLKHFYPPLSISISRDWRIWLEGEMYDVAAVAHVNAQEQQTGQYIWFQNVHTVYEPTPESMADTIGSLSGPYYHDAAPKDMVAWFQEHPYLRITRPLPMSVGGAHGVQFDASVDASAPISNGTEFSRGSACPGPTVPVFYYGSSSNLADDEHWLGFCQGYVKYRVIVLDMGGETVVIVIAAPVDDFGNFLPKVKQVLESVRWEE